MLPSLPSSGILLDNSFSFAHVPRCHCCCCYSYSGAASRAIHSTVAPATKTNYGWNVKERQHAFCFRRRRVCAVCVPFFYLTVPETQRHTRTAAWHVCCRNVICLGHFTPFLIPIVVVVVFVAFWRPRSFVFRSESSWTSARGFFVPLISLLNQFSAKVKYAAGCERLFVCVGGLWFIASISPRVLFCVQFCCCCCLSARLLCMRMEIDV